MAIAVAQYVANLKRLLETDIVPRIKHFILNTAASRQHGFAERLDVKCASRNETSTTAAHAGQGAALGHMLFSLSQYRGYHRPGM